MTGTNKNILVGIVAATIFVITVAVVLQRDHRVMKTIRHGGYESDTSTFRPTAEELRLAAQFSDTVLPQLKKLGLIVEVKHHDIETIVNVSGTIWKKRSPYFKEQFLKQLLLYNKISQLPTVITVMDKETSEILAVMKQEETIDIYY